MLLSMLRSLQSSLYRSRSGVAFPLTLLEAFLNLKLTLWPSYQVIKLSVKLLRRQHTNFALAMQQVLKHRSANNERSQLGSQAFKFQH